jgi:hypothetical protein
MNSEQRDLWNFLSAKVRTRQPFTAVERATWAELCKVNTADIQAWSDETSARQSVKRVATPQVAPDEFLFRMVRKSPVVEGKLELDCDAAAHATIAKMKTRGVARPEVAPDSGAAYSRHHYFPR